MFLLQTVIVLGVPCHRAKTIEKHLTADHLIAFYLALDSRMFLCRSFLQFLILETGNGNSKSTSKRR